MTQIKPADLIKAALLIVVFATFAMQTAMLRSFFYTVASQESEWSFHDRDLIGQERARPNLRVVAMVMGETIQATVRVASSLVFAHPEQTPLYQGTPWPDDGTRDSIADGPLVLWSAHLLFVGIALLPVLILAIAWYSGFWQRLVLLTLAMVGIAGWHPAPISLFFSAASLFTDWPLSYYLFIGNLQAYDLAALGGVALMVLYCARGAPVRSWQVATITIMATLTIEYLGVVFAAGLSAAIFFDSDVGHRRSRLLGVVRVAGVAFVAFLVTAATVFGIFFMMENTVQWQSTRYAGFVENNFLWFRTIIANMISMLSIPMGIGLLGGAVLSLMASAGERPPIRMRTIAALIGMMGSYLAVFAVGFLNLAYPSEMSRQFAPAMLLALLLGVALGDRVLSGLRRTAVT